MNDFKSGLPSFLDASPRIDTPNVFALLGQQIKSTDQEEIVKIAEAKEQAQQSQRPATQPHKDTVYVANDPFNIQSLLTNKKFLNVLTVIVLGSIIVLGILIVRSRTRKKTPLTNKSNNNNNNNNSNKLSSDDDYDGNNSVKTSDKNHNRLAGAGVKSNECLTLEQISKELAQQRNDIRLLMSHIITSKSSS